MVLFACAGCGGKKKKNSKKTSPKNSQNRYSKSQVSQSRNSKSHDGNAASSPIAISPPAVPTLRIRTIDFPEAPTNRSPVNESPLMPVQPTPVAVPIVEHKPSPPLMDSTDKFSDTLHENREMVKKILDVTPAEADVRRHSHMRKNPYELQQQEAAFAAMRGEQPKMQSFFPGLGDAGQPNPLQEKFNSELENKMKNRGKENVQVIPLQPLPTTLTAEVPLPPPVQAKATNSTAQPTPAPGSTAAAPAQAKTPMKSSIKNGNDSNRSTMNRQGEVKNAATPRGNTPHPQRPGPDPNKKPMNRNVISSYRTGTLTTKWTTEYTGTIKNIRDKKKERGTLVSIEEFNRELEAKLRKRSIYIENSAKARAN
ncbi:hypothetical protein PROFUN_05947 [Planoprotostelium fungivorum]|uniref:Uncharacterized protein n=1 Tax=Planoprotostelium fungivorum TaxID=1890364 RepID=A0A2P6N7P8_9EUKA|nr:hypothetical protein PROFUN_05947 [Planoprotostelium fungivorum]